MKNSISINDFNQGVKNGEITQIKPFTTGDGSLYYNLEKGNGIFVESKGRYFMVAKFN